MSPGMLAEDNMPLQVELQSRQVLVKMLEGYQETALSADRPGLQAMRISYSQLPW